MDKKKILIIDDEEEFSNFVKINLENVGKYEAKTQSNAALAINVIKQYKPDLIFLDILMPQISGTELYSQIKEEEDIKNIPIIFLTAIADKKEVRETEGNLGGHTFIAKPVSTDELIKVIEENIG